MVWNYSLLLFLMKITILVSIHCRQHMLDGGDCEYEDDDDDDETNSYRK